MSVSEELKRAGAVKGWDWSVMRDRMSPLGWSYPELLAEYVSKATRSLDVGTGGGEIFARAARSQDVAVDIQERMLIEARTRLPCPLVRADGDKLPFAGRSFDLIVGRHAGPHPREVLRLLVQGGHYLTQQVGGHICQNIFDAMGWGSNEEWWRGESEREGVEFWTTDKVAGFLRAAGCRIVRQEESWVDYEFLDEAALAFWLANAPLPEIDVDRDAALLDSLPLRTNWHAELLIIQR